MTTNGERHEVIEFVLDTWGQPCPGEHHLLQSLRKRGDGRTVAVHPGKQIV